MAEKPLTLDELEAATGLKRTTLQTAIETLADKVIHEGEGRRGSPYTYRAPWASPVDDDRVGLGT